MSSFLYYIKGLFGVFNLLLLLLFLAWLANRYNRKKISVRLIYTTIIIFLLCSTSFLPRFFASKLEEKYLPVNTLTLKDRTDSVYIHLLGSGYGLDERLPATAQLPSVAQGRLIEALRIFNAVDKSILVCSGGSVGGFESQASVVKKAAVMLGADSTRIITLDTPNTTLEEAEALANKLSTQVSVIVVTDATHMPRAINFFSRQGFKPIPAPTNYKVIESKNEPWTNWLPAIKHIQMMDMVIHEWLGNIKASF